MYASARSRRTLVDVRLASDARVPCGALARVAGDQRQTRAAGPARTGSAFVYLRRAPASCLADGADAGETGSIDEAGSVVPTRTGGTLIDLRLTEDASKRGRTDTTVPGYAVGARSVV